MFHNVSEMEYSYEEEETSDGDRELRPIVRRTAKHIAAGEERPRINSSQQTTPTEGKPLDAELRQIVANFSRDENAQDLTMH